MENMMNELVTVQNNQVVVDSRSVAEHFEKAHKHILCSIDNLVAENWATKKCFQAEEAIYRGRAFRYYLMNRDGFSLLVMGFTGRKALEWKLKYIQAFNWMEAKLKESQSLPTDYLSALKALVAAEEDRRKIEAKVQVLEPKANYYDDCMDSTKTFTATDVAKEIGFGKAAQLNEFLHNRGVLYRPGYRKNLSQKPLSCYPWLPTVAYDFLLSDGYAKIITGPEYIYLKWTNKGIKWLKELVVNSL